MGCNEPVFNWGWHHFVPAPKQLDLHNLSMDFDKLIWFQMLTTQTNHELE
jgi:hypothetical protein